MSGGIEQCLKLHTTFPTVIINIVIDYATHRILENVFNTTDTKKFFESIEKNLYSLYQREKKIIVSKIKNLLTHENQLLIASVNKGIKTCEMSDKQSTVTSLWRLLNERPMKNCWSRKKLNKFLALRNNIYARLMPAEEFVCEICRLLGTMIYFDLGIDALENKLFQCCMFNVDRFFFCQHRWEKRNALADLYNYDTVIEILRN